MAEEKCVDFWDDHTMFIHGEINDSLIEAIRFIIDYNASNRILSGDHRSNDSIRIFIDSVGGSLSITNALIQTIQASETPVYTIGLGKCLSSGALILMAGLERFAFPSTEILIHDGEMAYQQSCTKFSSWTDFAAAQNARVIEYILDNTKLTADDLAAHMSYDYWMFGDEAKDKGVIDQLIISLDDLNNRIA